MSETLPAIPDETANALAVLRTRNLPAWEALVQEAIDSEEQVWAGYVALALIHESGEFKVDHRSFKAYAQGRFGISESSAYRWLHMGQAVLTGPPAKSQRELEAGKKAADPRARKVAAGKRPRKPKGGAKCPTCKGKGFVIETTSTEACRHPVGRRIGKDCMVCGATVGAR